MVGINHFAPPGTDTGRYMGIFTFMNGVLRFVSPVVGGWLIYYFSRGDMLAIGGIGVLASAAHAFWAGAREKARPELATMADFESQFSESEGGGASYY